MRERIGKWLEITEEPSKSGPLFADQGGEASA